jgi:hypothetical protein
MKKKLFSVLLLMPLLTPLSLSAQVIDPPASSCAAKWTGEICDASQLGQCIIICYPEN